tara:strand:- start:4 stop:399 length:396 start_codon:yes stop_codon:yes gene_type:complete
MTNAIPLIDISVQPIELCKLLKIANMVGGGGEAKIVISEGYVLLNNEVEFQKRKKVKHDDIVEFNGEIIQVNYVKSDKKELAKITQKKSAKAAAKTNTVKSAKKRTTNADIGTETVPSIESNRSKRKPISF